MRLGRTPAGEAPEVQASAYGVRGLRRGSVNHFPVPARGLFRVVVPHPSQDLSLGLALSAIAPASRGSEELLQE